MFYLNLVINSYDKNKNKRFSNSGIMLKCDNQFCEKIAYDRIISLLFFKSTCKN